MSEEPPRLKITSLDAVRRKQIVWRIAGLVPAAMLSVLGGEQGTGKGLWVAAQAAELTRRGLTVLLAPAEDSPEYTLRPRLQAAGARMDLIHTVDDFVLPDDWPMLAEAMIECRPAWFVLDPVTEYISALYNENSGHALRQALKPLSVISDRTGTAITWIMHLNKTDSTNAFKRFAGSGGYTQIARSAMLLGRNPEDENPAARYLAHVKCSVAPLQPTTQWLIEQIYLEAADDEPAMTSARLVRVGESPLTAEQLLGHGHTAEERTEHERACELIRDRLLVGGEIESKHLDALGEAEGISRRTMERARRDVGVVAFQKHRKWWVRLRGSEGLASDRQSQTAKGGRRSDRPHSSTGGKVTPPSQGEGGVKDFDAPAGPAPPDFGVASIDELKRWFDSNP